MTGNKVALIYYSRTNNTQKAAEFLKEKMEEKDIAVDMIRIVPETKPGFFKAVRSARKQEDLPITNINYDLSDYETLVVCVPSWDKHPAPFYKSFLQNVDKLNEKSCAIFVSAGASIQKNTSTIKIFKNELKNLGVDKVIADMIFIMRRGKIIDGKKDIGPFIGKITR